MANIKEYELPDGTVLEFPGDMPDDLIQQRVRKLIAQQQPQQPIQSEIPINTPSILGQDRSS